MSLKKRNHIVLLLIFHFIMFALAMQGCKEGTKSSPVSALLDINGNTTAVIDLNELGEDVAKHTISGVVIARTSLETLGNINVSLFYEGKLAATTRTTSEGKFFFTKVPSGLFDLAIGADSEAYEKADFVIRVMDDGAMSPQSPEIQLTAKATSGPVLVKISGIVLSDKNDKLNNIDVELYKEATLVKTAVTGGDGSFFFENLAVGNYRLEVGKTSPVYISKNFNVNVLADGTISPAAPTIILSERSSESFTIEGIVKTQSNEALTNLRIDLRKNDSTSSVIDTTYSTGEGKFFFQNLTSGIYYLKVSASSNTEESAFYPVVILSNGTISPAKAEVLVPNKDLATTYNITGVISDAFSGGPIEYGTVKLTGLGNNLTDKTGKFSFQSLLPGLYELEISKFGFETLTVTFNLKADGTTSPATLNYQLIHSQVSGYGSIAGRLIDISTNQGIPNLIVRVYEYVQVTKTSLGQSETGFEIVPFLVLTTRTLDAGPGEPQDRKGTFKMTHLAPTTSTIKYALYFGTDNSSPTFIDVARPNSLYTWKEISAAPASYRYGVYGLSVEAGKTTFYTNYEHEK